MCRSPSLSTSRHRVPTRRQSASRRLAAWILLIVSPALWLGPLAAAPVTGPEAGISGALLPALDQPPEDGAPLEGPLQAEANAFSRPAASDDELVPMTRSVPAPLLAPSAEESPFFQILAQTGEPAASADEGAGPASGPDGGNEPDPEAGDDTGSGDPPGEEADPENWSPADAAEANPEETADEEADVTSTDPLPIEQRVGECTISGEVYDTATLDPIAGAIVTVKGTGREAETDAQGTFRIDGLPSGDYEIEALKLGYSVATTTASPRPDRPAEVRIALREKPAADTDEGEYMLAEESVVGEFREDGQGAFDLDLSVSGNLASGLGKEELSRTGVSDAAGAVSKISGANVIGGKYAVVRGLGDRYSNTLFNGTQISSADPSRKAVQLDLFPSHLLQDVSIAKTYSPDYTAEWAGGLVRLRTLSFPEERILEVEPSYGVSTNVLEADQFLTIPGSDLGFLGLGDGQGRITTDFGLESQNLNSNAARKAYWERLHSSRAARPQRDDSRENWGIDLTYGDTYELANGVEAGLVLGFTRGQEDEVILDQNQGRQFDPNTKERGFTQNLDEYTRQVDWGLLASGGLRFGGNHEINASYFRYRNAADTVKQFRDGQGPRGPRVVTSEPLNPLLREPFYGAAAFVYDAADQLSSLRRELEVMQVGGEHRFLGDDDRGPELAWSFANSSASEIRPHTSQFNFDQLDFADPAILDLEPERSTGEPQNYEPGRGVQLTAADLTQEGNAGTIIHMTRESLSTDETLRNGNIDLTVPWYVNGDEETRVEFSGGGSFARRDREVRGELFTLLAENSAVNYPDFIDRDDGRFGIGASDSLGSGTTYQDGSDIFDGESGGPDSLYYRRSTISRDTRRNVDASTSIDSLYLMGRGFLGPWELMGGARLESESRSFEILRPGELNFVAPTEQVRGTQRNEYVLPAFNLRRAFGSEDDIVVETAWSRTVGRPTFYEFAPIQTEDQGTGDVRLGNPALQDSLIDNFDLSFRYNPRPGSFLGLSLFHKSVRNPIIKRFSLSQSDVGSDVLTYDNANNGSIQGVELELGQDLLDHWRITANYTYINSSLETDVIAPGGGTRPVQIGFEGQPEHIFNLILGYNREEWGLDVNLVYNFTGEYLEVVPRSSIDDRVTKEARATLDLVIKKDVPLLGVDGTVTFKAGNLLAAEQRSSYQPSGLIYERYSPGRTFSLAYKTSF